MTANSPDTQHFLDHRLFVGEKQVAANMAQHPRVEALSSDSTWSMLGILFAEQQVGTILDSLGFDLSKKLTTC
jgi:hypothetical protein